MTDAPMQFAYDVMGVGRQSVEATNIAEAADKAYKVWGDQVVVVYASTDAMAKAKAKALATDAAKA